MTLTACTFVAANSSGEIEEDYGKRTLGTQVEDNTIEAKASASIKKLKENASPTNSNKATNTYRAIQRLKLFIRDLKGISYKAYLSFYTFYNTFSLFLMLFLNQKKKHALFAVIKVIHS